MSKTPSIPEIVHDVPSTFPPVTEDQIVFDPKTIGWWTFNKTLEDIYGGQDFESDTSGTIEYKLFKKYNLLEGIIEHKYGLLFNQSFSTYINGFSLSPIFYSMNCAFWYYSPGVIGFTKHALTKDLTPKIAPILAKAETNVENNYEDVKLNQGEWIISEIGSSPTQNAIQLSLCNQKNGPNVSLISDSFLPGFHHIYINIISANEYFYARIDIDGKFGDQCIITDNSLKLKNTTALLHLNKIGFGYTSHQTTQDGAYISDLILQTKGSTSANKTILMMRFGPDMALTSDSEYPGFSFFGIGYEQPSTVTTTQIVPQENSVLVARSNGDLLQGHKPIWDNEFTYNRPESLNDLDISSTGSVTWTPNGILIKGAKIKT